MEIVIGLPTPLSSSGLCGKVREIWSLDIQNSTGSNTCEKKSGPEGQDRVNHMPGVQIGWSRVGRTEV